jgi:hypothetical protein
MNKNQLQAMLASYARSVLGAGVALYMSGITDPKTLAYSLLGALVPVALRAINPKDAAFGKMPSVSQVEDAVKSVKVVVPKKSAAKKQSAKKATTKKATVK